MKAIAPTALTVVAIVAGVATPSPAAAAKATPCQAAASGKTVITKSRSAVVFAKGGNTYGCHLRKSKRAYKLAICCEREVYKLNGRFLGFTYYGSAVGDETSRVGVYDLLSGKRKLIGGEPVIDRGSFVVKSFVVSSKGGIAWFEAPGDGEGGSTDVLELHAAGVGASVPDRVLDTGGTLSDLALSRDGLTIRWTSANGTSKSAPLTP